MLSDGEGSENGGIFGKDQGPKKRRKSRTAFTNQQIYELEKRFLYQKYLTPADRDEIAQQLGLSNAQVITWFQNRRAKLKRDLEELKADVTAAKVIGKEPPGLLTRLEEMQAFTTHQSLLKWDKKHMKMVGGGGNGGKYSSGSASTRFNPMLMSAEQRESFLNSTLRELRQSSPNVDQAKDAHGRALASDDRDTIGSMSPQHHHECHRTPCACTAHAYDSVTSENSPATALDYSAHSLTRRSESSGSPSANSEHDKRSEQNSPAVDTTSSAIGQDTSRNLPEEQVHMVRPPSRDGANSGRHDDSDDDSIDVDDSE